MSLQKISVTLLPGKTNVCLHFLFGHRNGPKPLISPDHFFVYLLCAWSSRCHLRWQPTCLSVSLFQQTYSYLSPLQTVKNTKCSSTVLITKEYNLHNLTNDTIARRTRQHAERVNMRKSTQTLHIKGNLRCMQYNMSHRYLCINWYRSRGNEVKLPSAGSSRLDKITSREPMSYLSKCTHKAIAMPGTTKKPTFWLHFQTTLVQERNHEYIKKKHITGCRPDNMPTF